jgi:uncharacterized protein YlxW (UPF0749 family)
LIIQGSDAVLVCTLITAVCAISIGIATWMNKRTRDRETEVLSKYSKAISGYLREVRQMVYPLADRVDALQKRVEELEKRT